jgi:glycosyltransferase involved in cell wall biosynthesis
MPNLTVSIALASYNGARYIADQLKSFADQDRRPEELVITDDGSTDDTAKVVAGFARSAPFQVRFEPNPQRLGYNKNFARAIELCQGQVILMSDQDDVWLPAHVRRIAELFEAGRRIGFVTSNSTYTDDQLRPTGTDIWKSERFTPAHHRAVSRPWQFPAWARHRALAGHASALRADLRPLIFPLPDEWIYDQWIALACALFSRVAVLPDRLTLHRHHAAQAVANDQKTLAQWHADKPALGVDHFDREINRWEALLIRAVAHSDCLIDPRVPDVLRDRVRLLQTRQNLRRKGRFGRISGALAQLLAGRYHRSARGWLTFGRDVMG